MTSFREAMPAMLAHEGEWEGIYRHVDRDFTLVDQHRMWTRCEFPTEGEFVYIQHNRLSWDDGRVEERRFGGTWDGALLRWDIDRFSGFSWQTLDGVVLLRLDRKDAPGQHFVEMINLSADGKSRARTWQWFKDGQPFRRTLCEEWRIG